MPEERTLPKVYLGDGAYAEFSGYDVALTTWNGVEETNRIYVEPDALRILVEFAKQHGFKV